MADLYEKWEYEERQIKYVVNGQKTYDFWGVDWFLPLWDSEFVKFGHPFTKDIDINKIFIKNI